MLLHQQRQAYANPNLMLTYEFSILCVNQTSSDNYRGTSGLVGQVNCRNGNYFGRPNRIYLARLAAFSDFYVNNVRNNVNLPHKD